MCCSLHHQLTATSNDALASTEGTLSAETLNASGAGGAGTPPVPILLIA